MPKPNIAVGGYLEFLIVNNFHFVPATIAKYIFFPSVFDCPDLGYIFQKCKNQPCCRLPSTVITFYSITARITKFGIFSSEFDFR